MTEKAMKITDEMVAELNELLELAWGIIANANGGDWSRATHEWQGAAVRWRDRYHAWIGVGAMRGLDSDTVERPAMTEKP